MFRSTLNRTWAQQSWLMIHHNPLKTVKYHRSKTLTLSTQSRLFGAFSKPERPHVLNVTFGLYWRMITEWSWIHSASAKGSRVVWPSTPVNTCSPVLNQRAYHACRSHHTIRHQIIINSIITPTKQKPQHMINSHIRKCMVSQHNCK